MSVGQSGPGHSRCSSRSWQGKTLTTINLDARHQQLLLSVDPKPVCQKILQVQEEMTSGRQLESGEAGSVRIEKLDVREVALIPGVSGTILLVMQDIAVRSAISLVI